MTRLYFVRSATFLFLFLAFSACGQNSDQNQQNDSGSGDLAESNIPILRPDGGSEAVYTWIDEEGNFQIASGRDEIPESQRRFVRVQDPSSPPTDPTKVWVADLSTVRNGRFSVQEKARSEWTKRARSRRPQSVHVPDQPGDGGSPQESPRVVMYMTSHCPVCQTARSWMNSKGIAYVEKNVERDQSAAQELISKAQKQGVPSSGVPVFEIRGKLIPGFDQQALERALKIR